MGGLLPMSKIEPCLRENWQEIGMYELQPSIKNGKKPGEGLAKK